MLKRLVSSRLYSFVLGTAARVDFEETKISQHPTFFTRPCRRVRLLMLTLVWPLLHLAILHYTNVTPDPINYIIVDGRTEALRFWLTFVCLPLGVVLMCVMLLVDVMLLSLFVSATFPSLPLLCGTFFLPQP